MTSDLPTPTNTLDLDEIAEKWLRLCGACDAGMGSCICPSGDPRNVIDNLVEEVKRVRAELSQVQKERDGKHEAIRGYQRMLDDIRAATGTAGETKDDPPTDLRALSVVVADMRIDRDEARSALAALRTELATAEAKIEHNDQAAIKAIKAEARAVRELESQLKTILDALSLKLDEDDDTIEMAVVEIRGLKIAYREMKAAQAALDALRAEVGKIADELSAESYAYRHIAGRLRALVTDQSPRECSTCNGAAVVKCEAHVAGDGCEDLALRCPDCVTDQLPAAPVVDEITEAKGEAYRACAEEISGVLDVEIPAELPPDGEGWDWLITHLREVLREAEQWTAERDETREQLANAMAALDALPTSTGDFMKLIKPLNALGPKAGPASSSRRLAKDVAYRALVLGQRQAVAPRECDDCGGSGYNTLRDGRAIGRCATCGGSGLSPTSDTQTDRCGQCGQAKGTNGLCPYRCDADTQTDTGGEAS